MAQTLGIIDLVWQGTTLDIEKGAKVKLGGYKQNAVLVQGKTHYAREWEASEITATTVLQRGQKVSDLFLAGTGELQANADTGQSFIWPDAFISNRPEVTAGEGGKVEVKWMGGPYRELING